MSTFKKFKGALAFGAIMAFGVTACSSDQPGDSSTPAAISSNPAPAEAPPPMASAIPAAVVTASNTLPAGWPTDIPVPAGLELIHVLQSPAAATGKIAIYRGIADKATIVSQVSTELESAGYRQVSATNHGESISISTWAKGATKVALNINTAADHVTCSISVNPVE